MGANMMTAEIVWNKSTNAYIVYFYFLTESKQNAFNKK